MDFFECCKEQEAGHARADGGLGNCEVGRFQQHPDHRHDQRIGHEDDDGGQQLFGQAGGDGADDEEHEQQENKQVTHG